jgi:hypothetical protein
MIIDSSEKLPLCSFDEGALNVQAENERVNTKNKKIEIPLLSFENFMILSFRKKKK